MKHTDTRSNFSGSIGFVLAAAGSAVGLGNIWRFPYLAAKDGGGLFLLCYLILALTFGFTLLTTEIAIGRKTRQSPLTAYKVMHKNWGGIGILACLVPTLILPYYCAIGGWVLKYLSMYIRGKGVTTAADGYFTSFITSDGEPIVWFLIFLAATIFIVYRGVNKGIENYSKILMPILFILIIVIAVYSLTLTHTDADGVTRTGLQGFLIYVIPDFSGLTLGKLLTVLMNAMGQLFFSISVAMGIMIAYGSYSRKDTNLVKSINQIEICDTIVAFLAGLMIIPAVYTFVGRDGMSQGPGLMFVSLPKVFESMGSIGNFIGLAFFVMVAFAAITSSVSVLEAIVSSVMDFFHVARSKATIIVGFITLITGIIVCLGYNVFYFELALPNGSTAQILDILDYISNSCLMPLVALLTCILVGWIVGPQVIIDEASYGGYKFGRRKLYIVMVKYIAPVLLTILLLQAFGIFSL
jgi:NSS family neurotransmitter:Na+ symporter